MLHIGEQQMNVNTPYSDSLNNAIGGNFVYAFVIDNTFCFNDDSLQPRVIHDISFIEKNVLLNAIENEL